VAAAPIFAYIHLVMRNRLLRSAAAAAALALVAIPARAGDPPAAPLAPRVAPPASRGFLQSFLAPRMAVLMQRDGAAAADYASPVANPWTRDREVVDRVQRDAARATKSALKRYAVQTFSLDTWFVPLSGGRGGAIVGRGEQTNGAGLRFGFSHRAPRAEVSLPVAAGRMALSADTRGRLGATFRTTASDLRVGAAVDPSEHRATFDLTLRF